MIKRLVILVTCLPLPVLISACGSENEDLRAYVEEVKSRKSSSIEPIPDIKPYETFTYKPAGRRDPFSLPDKKTVSPTGTGPRPDPTRTPEPLEEFPIDGLRMVGTITVRDKKYALIRSPDNIIHRVTIGNYMGKNDGKIISVSNSEVKLRELIPDGFGSYTERVLSVALSQ